MQSQVIFLQVIFLNYSSPYNISNLVGLNYLSLVGFTLMTLRDNCTFGSKDKRDTMVL